MAVRWGWCALLTVALTLFTACSTGDVAFALSSGAGPSIHAVAAFSASERIGNSFKNLDPAYKRTPYFQRFHSFVMGGTWLVPERRVAPLPAAIPDLKALRENGHEATVTWIGHSTVLVQLDGVNFLTDPNWANRSGPFNGLIGVRRYTPAPIRLEDLPPIDFVLISHDHYDHLDQATVIRLARLYDPLFVVPLGITAWLADRGITKAVD